MFNRDYSITFFNEHHSYNTLTDWGLISDTPPMIPAPERIVNYVDVPGRMLGPIDMTNVTNYKTYYNRVSGSWTFYKDISDQSGLIYPARKFLYDTIRNALHGRKMNVRLSEDPSYVFHGRFSVSLPSGTTNPIQIQIAYDLDPMRYTMPSGTSTLIVDTSYLPDLS